jgi:uncharacterized membrane protein
VSPSEIILVMVLSIAPFIEVRGSVPLAYVFEPNDGAARAFLLGFALLGNLLIAPIVLPLLNKLEKFLLNKKTSSLIGPIARLYAWSIGNIRNRIPSYVRKYGHIGLAVFVAIPIPGSGAWSGALIAHILGLKGIKTTAAIEAGVIAAFTMLVLIMEGIASVIPW